ncbi:dihydrofolate reductase family protein [Shimia abyssi]|uniref:Dihydrofolate reductase n=1 Tax=Shimia abyssi TaxID=1662395 RepID=A0A2P8FEM0_9RHOB|nr:dihydrofolate reductase family protein [Shimia abyssi]PSL20118.1 dihydrofolate reductase [Shimia abyssi]
MPTGHVFIATSLDGFVARPDHGLDWLMKQPVDEHDTRFDDFMASVDGLIMGSGSFRTVLGFGQWPYEKPVIVMSRSLTPDDIPEDLQDKVRISAAPPEVVIAELDKEGWTRAYVDGGGLVQSFLRAGLIADLEITTVPVLIGSGIRLFGELDGDIDLDLISTSLRKTGLMTTFYRVRQD